ALCCALPAGQQPAERLRGIRRGRRHQVDLFWTKARSRQAGLDGACRKRDLELAPRQPLFLDREAQPSILQQRGAGIVSVPDAENVQWLEEQVLAEPGA